MGQMREVAVQETGQFFQIKSTIHQLQSLRDFINLQLSAGNPSGFLSWVSATSVNQA